MCVTGTAGHSAPEVCKNAPLSVTFSQKLFQLSEQSSWLNQGTFPPDSISFS